jgi:hypothetical protein
MLRALAALLLLTLAGLNAAGQTSRTVPQVQDLWWGGPEESGWGLSIIQHDDRLFCSLLVYDETAHTTWFVISGGTWNDERTEYTAPIYWPRAPGQSFDSYDATRFEVGPPAGQATLAFSSQGAGSLRYALTSSGYQGEKQIRRMTFAAPAPGRFSNLTDMWWGGVSQAGWAVSIVQQGDELFLFWLTYFDQNIHPREGFPSWLAMPGGTWTSANVYEGAMYRPYGALWLGRPGFDANRVSYPNFGPYKLTFLDANRATLQYQVLGTAGMIELTRFGF